MKLRRPDYYQMFECIGSDCEDSCCAGWEIDVDDEAYGQYCRVQGKFGERLMGSVSHTRPYHFIMNEDRCPFLNESNLCDIYIQLGEKYLCQICTDHPRFYESYGNRKEAGLGLVCEEAARLILNREQKVRFIDEGPDEEEETEEEWFQVLDLARDQTILLLQERERPLGDRLSEALSAVSVLQEDYNRQDMNAMYLHIHKQKTAQRRKESLSGLQEWCLDCIEFLQNLEILTSEWVLILDAASAKIQDQTISFSGADEIFYEQLMIYFVYRYFLRSVYDYQLLDKMKFAVFGCLAIRVLETAVSEEEQVPPAEIARLYSKEIEYSEDNMEAFNEEMLFSDMFDTQLLSNTAAAVFGCSDFQNEGQR